MKFFFRQPPNPEIKEAPKTELTLLLDLQFRLEYLDHFMQGRVVRPCAGEPNGKEQTTWQSTWR